MSKEVENIGLPTALITTLVRTALFTGAFRVIPGRAINHPVGDPSLSLENERGLRRRIVLTALEALQTEVTKSKIFDWTK